MTKHPQQWRNQATPAQHYGRFVLALVVAVGSWIVGVSMVIGVIVMRAFKKR